MKRVMRVAILAALAAPVVACTTSNQQAAAPSTTIAATPAAATTTMRRGEINDQDKVLISQLDAYWLKTPRADLIQAAEKACTMMRAGQKMEMIAILSGGKVEGGSVTADTTELGHAATFIHAAATAYCPDQLTGVN